MQIFGMKQIKSRVSSVGFEPRLNLLFLVQLLYLHSEPCLTLINNGLYVRGINHFARAVSSLYLTLRTEVYMATSNTQLLDGSSTYWTSLLFHVWTHDWSVATLISIKVIELVFSLQSDSLLKQKSYGIIKDFSFTLIQL